MTLDEAIKHAEEVAEKFESLHERYENMDEDRLLFRVEENECKNCAKEHRQLANWLKELKQLRKQEPCEDAISRKSILDYMKYLHGEMLEEEFVKALPSVIPKKDGWTPCSERMPKPKETENLIAKYYLVQNEYGDMMVARWDGNGWEQMYQHEYLKDDVVAWRPLPERYEYEGDNNDK